jgi:transcriptional regulator with XRE-family HTH domain
VSEQLERNPINPDNLVRERLDDLRGRRSLQQIADAVAATGFEGLSRPALNRVINGGQPLRVSELFALAAALDVSPLHFLVPDDEDARVAVTPNDVVDPRTLMTWLRGKWPSVGGDPNPGAFFRSMPAPVVAEMAYNKGQADADVERMRQEHARALRESRTIESELAGTQDDGRRLELARELGRLEHYRHVRACAIRKATGADVGGGPPTPADAFYALGDDDLGA